LHRARDRFDALEALSETDLARLEQLRESLDSVARDRTYHFKSYPNSMIGSEVVDHFIATAEITPGVPLSSREEATALGQELLEVGMIRHVCDDHEFQDAYLFYTPAALHDDRASGSRGKSVAQLVAENGNGKDKEKGGLMMGWVDKKYSWSWKGWGSVYLVLPQDEATIYVYKNDVATQPLQRLCVGDCNVSCSVSFCGTCRDGYYCFTVESSDEGGKKTGSNVFCSDDTAEQERWIQALINAGASFTENQNKLVKDAHSFYEFKVPDQSKEEVSLDRYRGNVSLVVNVATK